MKRAEQTEKITLEVACEQFTAWRASKKSGSRIPAQLWDSALILCEQHPPSKVSHALRLNFNDLKKRLALRKTGGSARPSEPRPTGVARNRAAAAGSRRPAPQAPADITLCPADTAIILDFETTGLSPEQGDRAIEIGAVRIENGVIIERFQKLMNPGRRIAPFIEDYTGITNQMLKKAPPCAEVMAQFADFIDGHNLIAHNASFDKRFLDAELERISRRNYSGQFACSLLAARRIYQAAPNYKLGTLVKYVNIAEDGAFHRALYDSEMTTKLWLSMLDAIERRYNKTSIPFSLMQKLTQTAKNSVDRLLSRS